MAKWDYFFKRNISCLSEGLGEIGPYFFNLIWQKIPTVTLLHLAPITPPQIPNPPFVFPDRDPEEWKEGTVEEEKEDRSLGPG